MKLLALGAFTGVVNLPSGVARVHVEKFSPGWFVAVRCEIQVPERLHGVKSGPCHCHWSPCRVVCVYNWYPPTLALMIV